MSSRRDVRLSGSDASPRGRGWVHLGALLIAVPAAVALIVRDPTRGGVALYAVTLVALYGVSAAYHLLPLSAAARWRMRHLDHAVIYVFIASSYAPFCLLVVGGTFGHVVLAMVAVGTLCGLVITVTNLERHRRLSGALYIIIGWLAIVMLPRAFQELDATQITLFVAMGVLYTAGAAVLAARWPDPFPETFGYHEVWHAMVTLASACYFVVVWSLAASPK